MERKLYADQLSNGQISVLNKIAESKTKSTVRPRSIKEDQMVKMDMIEFLTMAGGGVILGVGVYVLSFLG